MKAKLPIFLLLLIILFSFTFGQESEPLFDGYLSLNDPVFRVLKFQSRFSTAPPDEISGEYKPVVEDAIVPGIMRIFEKKSTFQANGYYDQLAVYLEPVNAPIRIFLNNVQIYVWGNYQGDQISEDYVSTDYLSHVVPMPPQLINQEGPNELVYRLYPVTSGNPVPRMMIGPRISVSSKVFWRNVFRVYLIQGSSILAFFMFIYFLMLSFSEKKRFDRNLWFSLFALSYIFAYFEISLGHSAVSETLVKQFSKVGFVGCMLFITLFIFNLTGIKWKAVKYLLGLVSCVFAVLFFIQKDILGIDRILNLVMYFFFAPLLVLNVVLAVRNIIHRMNLESFITAASFIVVIATSFHDIIYILSNEIPYAYLTAYGFTALVLGMFAVLAIGQRKLTLENAVWARSAEDTSQRQGAILSRISQVSGNLTEAGSRLDQSVSESAMALSESTKQTNTKGEEIVQQLGQAEGMIDTTIHSLKDSSAKIPESLNSLSTFSESLNTIITDFSQKLLRITENAASTGESAKELKSRADDGEALTRESAEAVARIGEYSDFLENLLVSIQDTSETMHILSMNAAIEAARTGSAGKGFAVIAHEIRALSQNTTAQVHISFDKLKEMRTEMTESSNASQKLSVSLNAIISKASESARQMEEVIHDLRTQDESTKELLDRTQELSRIAASLQDLSKASSTANDQLTQAFDHIVEPLTQVRKLVEYQKDFGKQLENGIRQIEQVGHDNLIETKKLEKLLE